MKVRWLGHSAVLVEGSRSVLIDPFLTGNPKAPFGPEGLGKVDVVVVTHDHADHLGDAHAIARRTGAVFVGTFELATAAAAAGVEETEGMNIGGSITTRGVGVHMTEAQHTCAQGHVTGVVVELDGKRIYHAGDTGLFSDMRLVAEFLGPLDLACLPIGDRFTMGPTSAARAVEFLEPKTVLPIHHGTWPPIEVDPREFVRRVGSSSPLARVVLPRPGEAFEI